MLRGADATAFDVHRSGRQQLIRALSQKAQYRQTQYQHRKLIPVQALRVRRPPRIWAALTQTGGLPTIPDDACQCPVKDYCDVP